MQLTIWRLVFTGLLFLYPMVVFAYVGPGLGLGAIGVILGVIGSILLAIFAIFWYPFKRFLKRKKQKQVIEDENTPPTKKSDEEDKPPNTKS